MKVLKRNMLSLMLCILLIVPSTAFATTNDKRTTKKKNPNRILICILLSLLVSSPITSMGYGATVDLGHSSSCGHGHTSTCYHTHTSSCNEHPNHTSSNTIATGSVGSSSFSCTYCGCNTTYTKRDYQCSYCNSIG